jgi:hypothetical protein
MKTVGFTLTLTLLLLFSCRKDSFINSPDAAVTITADTIKYDTVFPTTGSVTQQFKIINENKQKLLLSSVKLMGGTGSAYKMNIDGIATTESNNIEVAANDSIYVFVQVNVNPNVANLPFVIRDSIQVSYNGNNRMVQLEAWGQNAHFLRDKQVLTNETWTNDLPYVILGFLHVNPNVNLTIEKGSRIYVHADAPIIIDGSLTVNGLKDTADRVYFRGDRLDDPYKDFPASWPGIFFSASSKDNVMNYAVIKNSFQSIAVEDPSPNANPKLTMNQCIIDNSYDAGIIASNSSITAINCLFSNCGKNIALIKGGTYRFTHCTAATYSSTYIDHKNPVLTVFNYDGNNVTAALDAEFRNCIFWGDNGLVENEVVVDKKGTTAFNVTFNQALWKVKTTPSNINIINPPPINNLPPQFDSINTSRHYYDFHLRAGSPAENKGTGAGVLIDLDGKTRSATIPELGCYER